MGRWPPVLLHVLLVLLVVVVPGVPGFVRVQQSIHHRCVVRSIMIPLANVSFLPLLAPSYPFTGLGTGTSTAL